MDSQTFLTVIGFASTSDTGTAGVPAIQNLVATPNGHNIDLTFFNTVYEGDNNSGYDQVDIYRKDNLTNTYTLLDSLQSAPVQTEMYQDPQGSGLVIGVTYTYKLQGTLNSVLSAFSNEASAVAA